MEEKEIKTHPSFGMVRWSRIQGHKDDLFGSSIEHNHYISLVISEGSVRRDLSREWYFEEKPIIEIDMSPIQFAEFMISPNTSGQPCTISYRQDKGSIKGIHIDNQRTLAEKDFEGKLKNIATNFDALKDFVKILETKTSLTVADKRTLNDKIFQVKRQIDDHIPFIQNSFNEQLDKTVMEAKATIEAFVEHKIRQTGLEALRGEVKLLGDSNDSKELV